MPMYALGVVPLIRQLAGIDVFQVWYTDDASAGVGSCWTAPLVVSRVGPDFGYFPNPSKTVKPSFVRRAKTLLHGTGSYYYL